MGSSFSDGPNTFIYYYRGRSYNGDSLYLLLATLLLGINPFRGVTGYFHLCISSGIKRDFPIVSSGHVGCTDGVRGLCILSEDSKKLVRVIDVVVIHVEGPG